MMFLIVETIPTKGSEHPQVASVTSGTILIALSTITSSLLVTSVLSVPSQNPVTYECVYGLELAKMKKNEAEEEAKKGKEPATEEESSLIIGDTHTWTKHLKIETKVIRVNNKVDGVHLRLHKMESKQESWQSDPEKNREKLRQQTDNAGPGVADLQPTATKYYHCIGFGQCALILKDQEENTWSNSKFRIDA
ncbi:hypothetical protein N7474_002750 [Penicillium riverlandense]|uniref:uncharacterized protein n=1 Tax=Penicillium riverlandense TaxID=1903569 RepID=UPI002549179C|nr:uncharacterized protein N7474_002750 [Penicillium riverlandense]KAJ5825612.1 hypothetical protein N7474_002750 [Penicillium riverlandense]